MAVPTKIKINREEEYYTHYIGKYSGENQFMALIGATLPEPLPKDWTNHKKWYAILHTFNSDGKHIESKAVFAGRTCDGEDDVVDKARVKRNKMVSSLENVSFEDIKISLFSTEIDGFIFGLVDGSERKEGIEKIVLLPNDLEFFSPWDGEYDT